MNMNSKCIPFLLVWAIGIVSLGGCSTQAWYGGMKLSAENECRRRPSGDIDGCLARVNKMSYEEYERKRSGQTP
jgi:hypothetical protein